MSYTKLHYTITDFSSGIQSVNQLRDNLSAVGDGYSLEHSPREATGGRGGGIVSPPRAESFGRHQTPKVCRAIVRSTMTTTASVTFPGAIIVAPVVTAVVRFSTGVFFIGIADLQEFYAVAEAEQASATPQRFVRASSGFGGAGGLVGIVISCYEKASSGAAFDLTDYDWSAHIYGTVP